MIGPLGSALARIRRRRRDAPDRRLVLHLGSQKTGTTAAQRWCRRHADELADAGVAVRATQPEIRQALGGWYEVTGREAGLSALLSQAFDAGAQGVFYSCESNVGPMFDPPLGSLYPRFLENVAAIERATAGYDRLVQFTVRDLGACIESAYIQRLRQGRYLPFEEFLGRIEPDSCWQPLVTELVRTFGRDRVIIYDYQRDRSDDVPLVGRLLDDAFDHLGLPGIADRHRWKMRTNVRYTQRMAELAMAVLPRLRDRQEKEALTTFINTMERGDEPPASFLTPEQRDRWSERYQRDLSELGRIAVVR